MSDKLKLSAAQVLGLTLAAEADLVRWPGGYWTRKGEPHNGSGSPSVAGIWRDVPQRHVGTNTMRGLWRRGLIERTHVHPEEWHDERRITESGRALLSRARED